MGIGNGVVIRFLADTGSAIRDIGRLERATGKSMTGMQRATAVWKKNIGPALATGAVAAGAAIGAAMMKGISSAVEDESSQARLAQAMRNTLDATDDQIASMEDYITLAQRRAGVDDGEMRTGLARLLRSTRNATRAQNIMNTAMEISAATGKPLGTVVEALAKFNDGNAGALKRLGISQGEATRNYADYTAAVKNVQKAEERAAQARETYGPKSKEYADAQKKVADATAKIAAIKGDGGIKWLSELNKQFSGSVAADAGTYAGKMERISTAYDELLEAFGAGLLGNMGGANDVMGDFDDTLYDLQPTAEKIGDAVGTLATNLGNLSANLGPVYDVLKKIDELRNVEGLLRILTLGNLGDIAYLNEGIDKLTNNGWAPPNGLTGTGGGNLNGGPVGNPYSQYRPMATRQRYTDSSKGADARAAAVDAKTRANP